MLQSRLRLFKTSHQIKFCTMTLDWSMRSQDDGMRRCIAVGCLRCFYIHPLHQ